MVLSVAVFVASAGCCCGQSYDERIAAAMNGSDWFALDSIYSTAPEDSVSPFFDVFSRCLIGNRLNRPDVSVPAFGELFNNYSEQLDMGNLLNSSVMFAMDLSRIGENRAASDMLSDVFSATREYLDDAWTESLHSRISLYGALADYSPYGISFDGGTDGRIPFSIEPVGPEDKGSVLMHLGDSYINGVAADITFDTGAGVNVISDSLAVRYGLVPLEASARVAGHGIQSGYHAIARELKIGNITVTDVPFSVMEITSGNEEADRYIDCFMIVVGSELMLQLKEMTLDFVNREITVPSAAPARSGVRPNICFSSGMNLLTRGVIHDNPMLMCIDTGDASYGSLNSVFFDKNREYVTSHATPDTIRSAGIGGVHMSLCYRMPDMTLELGGGRTVVPEMIVAQSDNPANGIMNYECNIGLKTLMRFGRLRFNMVDFTLSALQDGL